MRWSDSFQSSVSLENLLSRPQSDVGEAESTIEKLEDQDAIAFSTRYYDVHGTLIACYFSQRYKYDLVSFVTG